MFDARGGAHLAFTPLTVWLFFFFSVEFPQRSHLFNGNRGIATSLKNSSPCVWYKITCLLGSLDTRHRFSAENVRWNEFINPRAFAELAVFLKGYQTRCGEVRQGSLVASEFTFQTSPTAVRFEQRPTRRSLLRKLVGPSLRDVLVSLLRGVGRLTA